MVQPYDGDFHDDDGDDTSQDEPLVKPDVINLAELFALFDGDAACEQYRAGDEIDPTDERPYCADCGFSRGEHGSLTIVQPITV